MSAGGQQNAAFCGKLGDRAESSDLEAVAPSRPGCGLDGTKLREKEKKGGRPHLALRGRFQRPAVILLSGEIHLMVTVADAEEMAIFSSVSPLYTLLVFSLSSRAAPMAPDNANIACRPSG